MNIKKALFFIIMCFLISCSSSKSNNGKEAVGIGRISFEYNSYVLEKMGMLELTYRLNTPEKPSDINFQVSDESILQLVDSKKGIVKAGQKLGEVVVTITAQFENSQEKASTVVRVIPVQVSKLLFNNNSIKLEKGSQVTPQITILPLNADDKTLTFSSNNSNIASVDNNGVITGINEGNAVITALSKNNIKASLNVEVVKNTIKSTGLKFINTPSHINIGDEIELHAEITPQNTYNKHIIYSSSDITKAVVSDNGRIRALGSGYVIIKGVMEDSKVSAEVKISINKGKPLEQINFPKAKLLLYDNDEQLVTVKTTPKDAEYKDISFITNNSNALSLQQLYKDTSLLKQIKQGKRIEVSAIGNGCIYGDGDPRCNISMEVFTVTNQQIIKPENIYTVFPYIEVEPIGRVSVQLKLGSKMNPLNAVFFEPSNTTERNLEVYVYDIEGSSVLLKESDNKVTANSIGKARVVVQVLDNPDIIPVEFDVEVTAEGYIDSAPPVATVTSINILDKTTIQGNLSAVGGSSFIYAVSKNDGQGVDITDYQVISSNREVVDIIDNRWAVSKKSGNAVITVISADVRANNGSKVEDSLTITVQ